VLLFGGAVVALLALILQRSLTRLLLLVHAYKRSISRDIAPVEPCLTSKAPDGTGAVSLIWALYPRPAGYKLKGQGSLVACCLISV
jgi:hypothetical protein